MRTSEKLCITESECHGRLKPTSKLQGSSAAVCTAMSENKQAAVASLLSNQKEVVEYNSLVPKVLSVCKVYVGQKLGTIVFPKPCVDYNTPEVS